MASGEKQHQTVVNGTIVNDGTKDYQPLRSSKYDLKKPHITETPITWGNWYQHVNWLNCTLIIGVPLAGLVAAYWTPLNLYTAIFSFVYYFNTGLGITAGMYQFLATSHHSTRGTDLEYRLPSPLGPHLVQGPTAPADISGCRRRWRRRGLHQMVVERSPCSPPLHRH
jgi:hypothetical protein